MGISGWSMIYCFSAGSAWNAGLRLFAERGDKNNEPTQRGGLKADAQNWSQDRFLIAGENQTARKELYDALQSG